MLHVICTRLRPGHLNVRVGDSSRHSETFECKYYYYHYCCCCCCGCYIIIIIIIIIFFFFFFFFFFFYMTILISGCSLSLKHFCFYFGQTHCLSVSVCLSVCQSAYLSVYVFSCDCYECYSVSVSVSLSPRLLF